MSGNFKKFTALCIAGLISATGSGMTSFALGIFVYQMTQMSAMAGLLILLGFAPNMLLSPIAGVLADRYDRRLLMMMGDGLSMIGLFIILACMKLFSMNLLSSSSLLIGISTGVVISSCFSSLIEPSFRATVSDLLEKDEYSKASGMIQISSSARYLLSPILAGFILSFSSITTILITDILTIALTLPMTYLIRREMKVDKNSRKYEDIGDNDLKTGIKQDLKKGFQLIYNNRGIWSLVLLGIYVSFCLGTIQTLMAPMILAFSNEAFLGFATTFSACGMIAAGVIISKFKITGHFCDILSRSLFLIGLFMIGFCIREDKLTLCFFGFLMFGGLPFANMSIDYLVRSNTQKEDQGKIWGMIGVISQLGYIAAYATSGLAADFLLKPLLMRHLSSQSLISKFLGLTDRSDVIKVGGRSAALVIIIVGIMLCIGAVVLSKNKEVKKLEGAHVPEAVYKRY